MGDNERAQGPLSRGSRPLPEMEQTRPGGQETRAGTGRKHAEVFGGVSSGTLSGEEEAPGEMGGRNRAAPRKGLDGRSSAGLGKALWVWVWRGEKEEATGLADEDLGSSWGAGEASGVTRPCLFTGPPRRGAEQGSGSHQWGGVRDLEPAVVAGRGDRIRPQTESGGVERGVTVPPRFWPRATEGEMLPHRGGDTGKGRLG